MKRMSDGRRAQREPRHVGQVLARENFGDAVDMAGDDMAAQLVAELEGAFEIDAGAVAPAADSGQPQRFGRGVDRKPGAAVLLAGRRRR